MHQYTLAVKRDFVARHYLFGGDWGAENQLHSHHYQVEVQLEGRTLDKHGYLVDIVAVEAHLEELVAYYRDQTLNDLPEFAGLNPSIERFARLLGQSLWGRISEPLERGHGQSLGKRHRLGGLPRGTLVHVGLLIYGSLSTISGGFIYDRNLVRYLRESGDRVDVISLPWRPYGVSLLDNLNAGLRRRLAQAAFDVLVQDELVHPSCFWLNQRLRPG